MLPMTLILILLDQSLEEKAKDSGSKLDTGGEISGFLLNYPNNF